MARNRDSTRDVGESSDATQWSVDRVLHQLGNLLSLPRFNRTKARRLMGEVITYGEQEGFTAHQANKVVRIALRGGTSRRSVLPNVASALIRCIRPAPDQLFGPTFVLIILGALGGDIESGASVVGNTSSFVDSDDDDDDSDFDASSDDMSDRVDEPDERRQKRKLVEVRLQAHAIRLLLQLYSPPSIVTWAGQLDGDPSEQIRNANLPASFLTNQAKRMLETCYGVLFHFLDYETLRPLLCHLLCLITRRKHVRHYRISKLLSLRAKLPSDVGTEALLNVYATFYPDMLFSGTGKDHGSAVQTLTNHVQGLRYPNVKWLIGVHAIWRRARAHQDNRYVEEASEERVERSTRRKRGRRNRFTYKAESELLPFLTPSTSVLMTHESTLLLSELSSLRELGYRFDKVNMPNQYASALSHRITAVALLARQTGPQLTSTFARLHEWTMSAISDQLSLPLLVMQGSLPLERTELAHDGSAALMNGLRTFVERVGCCDERIQARLYRIIQASVWNGLQSQERRAFFGLMELFVPVKRTSLEEKLLQRLEQVAELSSEDEISILLRSMANMVANWAAQDWQSILRRLDDEEVVHWGTNRLSRQADYVETIVTTVTYASRIADKALCDRPHSISVLHACLYLHEVILSESLVGLHDLLLPPTFTLYLPVFSQFGAVMTLSRLFGVIHTVRLLHQDYMAALADGLTSDTTALDGFPVPSALVERRTAFFAEECSDRINDCVILLLDLIWRNNGFVSVEAGNVEVGIPLEFFSALTKRCRGRGDELQQIGSASHSATLGILMEAYANDLVRERGGALPVVHGPLTPAKLKQARRHNFPVISHRDFRDSFLNWLARQGAKGISELLNATITRFIRGQEVDQSTVFS